MDIQGVNNIGIAVSDVERAASFYKKLGFEVVDRDETPAVTLQSGNAVLYLFQTQGERNAAPRKEDLVHNPVGLDHISFDVKDVDILYTQLKDTVSFETTPADQPWGFRACSLLDSDGNRLYFLSPLT